MSTVFGSLAANDSEYAFVRTVGQELSLQVAQQWIADRMAEFMLTTAIFVEGRTEAFKTRYMKPGAGFMQRRGAQARGGSRKAYGSWDVEYPLEDWEDIISWDDVDIAYMSAEILSNHIETAMNSYINTYRNEVLYRILNNTQGSFTDPNHGALTPEPLANGDAVTYPPVTGEPTTEAIEDHYLESGYAAANISDTNNPLETNVADLVHHFGGRSTGGENIITFCNNAQTSQLGGLTSFTEVPDNFIIVGDNVDVPTMLPLAPGRTLGRSDGTWVQEYDFIPENYLVTIHLEEPAPLMQRHDPLVTGLGVGDLMLVAQDERHPFTTSAYRARFGVGAGNRLNGVVMELGTGGTYTVPTDYDY